MRTTGRPEAECNGSNPVDAEPPGRKARGRPALPREHQRRRLLEAANRVFETKSYKNARIADIVREAGMSSRSFYELFDSKADLVAEVARSLAEAFIQRWDEIFEATDDLVLNIDRGLHAYLELFRVAHVDLDHLRGKAGTIVRNVRRATVQEIGARMTKELQRAYERGELGSPPDPVRVEILLNGIVGVSFRYYSDGRRDALQALHPAIVALVRDSLLQRRSRATS